MSLIYSRPRIRLPKFLIINKNGNFKNNKTAKFFLIIFIICFIIGIIVKAVVPVFNKLCTEKATAF